MKRFLIIAIILIGLLPIQSYAESTLLDTLTQSYEGGLECEIAVIKNQISNSLWVYRLEPRRQKMNVNTLMKEPDLFKKYGVEIPLDIKSLEEGARISASFYTRSGKKEIRVIIKNQNPLTNKITEERKTFDIGPDFVDDKPTSCLK